MSDQETDLTGMPASYRLSAEDTLTGSVVWMPIYSQLRLLFRQREVAEGARKRYSIRKIAEVTGVDRGTVLLWMSDKPLQRIDAEAMEKFCKYLGKTFNDILGYSPIKGDDENKEGGE